MQCCLSVCSVAVFTAERLRGAPGASVLFGRASRCVKYPWVILRLLQAVSNLGRGPSLTRPDKGQAGRSGNTQRYEGHAWWKVGLVWASPVIRALGWESRRPGQHPSPTGGAGGGGECARLPDPPLLQLSNGFIPCICTPPPPRRTGLWAWPAGCGSGGPRGQRPLASGEREAGAGRKTLGTTW